MSADHKLLRIYLQDHFAAAKAGVELARRTAGANEATEFEKPLARLRDEIESDRESLEAIMGRLGFGPDRAKIAAAWGAEKAGRLKLNGALRGYSPLSRIVELEGLTAGVRAKLSLWEVLLSISDSQPELNRSELEELQTRASKQLETLTEQRLRAAKLAFRP